MNNTLLPLALLLPEADSDREDADDEDVERRIEGMSVGVWAVNADI
jgi:hypothetical protein